MLEFLVGTNSCEHENRKHNPEDYVQETEQEAHEAKNEADSTLTTRALQFVRVSRRPENEQRADDTRCDPAWQDTQQTRDRSEHCESYVNKMRERNVLCSSKSRYY